MNCSREEIERKRLAALEKRKSKLSNGAQAQNPASVASSSSAPSFHTPPQRDNSWQAKVTSPNAYNGNYSKIPTKLSANSYHPYSKPAPVAGTSNTNATQANGDRVVTGTVYLISEDRFEVNPSEFCVPLIEIFKTLQSRNYDTKSRLWSFGIQDYEALMDKVLPLRPHVVLGPLPPFVLKVLKEPCVSPDSIDLTAIEATLRNKLLPFQAEGVRFGIAKRGRCMIADDMGLGKTFQAIAIASYYKENWPLLIVTTSSMRETWQEKIHELLPGTPLVSVATLGSARDCETVADPQTEVVIVSYKIAATHVDLLKQKKFGVVIIDESHNLKSRKAQCTVALTSVTRGARRVVLLSGTPALSRPAELYTQLAIIEPRTFTNFTEYGKRYCGGKLTNFGWDMSGQSHLAELQALLQRRFLIRRTKEQVLTKLQDKIRESVILDPSLLRISKEEQQGLSQMAQKLVNTKSSEKQAALLTFFSESSRVKIPAICKYIAGLVRDASTGKFLVFAHHRSVVDAVCLTLDELRTHYVCIVGSTPSALRSSLVDKFQLSDSCRCAVLSVTAAGAGVTLTAAQLVVFAELHWNPGVLNEVGLSKDNFDDTACTKQETKNGIMQYLTSPSSSKDKSDYIPGTNIRKHQLPTQEKCALPNDTSHRQSETDDVDKSFLEDEEGDDLLANIDL